VFHLKQGAGMMRRLRWSSLFAIVLALVVSSNAAQAAPVTRQGTGQICVLAFDDQNGNGVREADEPLLAGVSFTLADTTKVKDSYKTDGNSEPHCFSDLVPAQYTVQARKAATLEVTTEGQWVVPLASGAQFDVTYGARKIDSSATRPAAGGSMSDLGRFVLGGLGLVVLAGAGLLALTTLQRARGNR
jgi:hypothetical protein